MKKTKRLCLPKVDLFVADYNKAIKELAILAYPVDYLNITVTENKRLQNFPSSLV